MKKRNVRSTADRDLDLKAKLFRGLGDESRLMIIDVLRNGPKCVYEIAESARLSQPNTSAHLGCLAECGLVQKERRGKFIYYRVAHRQLTSLLSEADAILARAGDGIFGCTRYERDGKQRKTDKK